MRLLSVASFIVCCAISTGADSIMVPLVDPSDPVLITSARLEFEDDIRPVLIVALENRTERVIDSHEIYLDSRRFYTRGEMTQAGNRKIWDCGLGRWATDPGESRLIAPKERVSLRIPFEGADCVHNREHEHFSIEVSRIGARFSTPSWKRDPKESARLLFEAQPHP